MSSSDQPKVAYLMGAGASAQRLPVIANMGPCFEEQLKWIDKHRDFVPNTSVGGNVAKNCRDILETYINQLRELPNILSNHVSIDTYARWLEVNRHYRRLDELKASLTLFFTIEQFRMGFDPRYESFVGALMDPHRRKIPDDLIVLTWNYDQHLALALARSGPFSQLRDVMDYYKICSLYAYDKCKINKFSIIHLNGIAGVYSRMSDYALLDDFKEEISSDTWAHWLFWFAMIFHDRTSNEVSLFRYSWEISQDKDFSWSGIENRLAEVEELIVIGYNFPDFNREVDLRCTSFMKKLKRIVIQTKSETMDGLLAKMTMIMPQHHKLFVPYPLVHEFYIPNELLMQPIK